MVLVIVGLLAGATSVAPLSEGVRRWLWTAMLLAAAVFLGVRFLL